MFLGACSGMSYGPFLSLTTPRKLKEKKKKKKNNKNWLPVYARGNTQIPQDPGPLI